MIAASGAKSMQCPTITFGINSLYSTSHLGSISQIKYHVWDQFCSINITFGIISTVSTFNFGPIPQ